MDQKTEQKDMDDMLVYRAQLDEYFRTNARVREEKIAAFNGTFMSNREFVVPPFMLRAPQSAGISQTTTSGTVLAEPVIR